MFLSRYIIHRIRKSGEESSAGTNVPVQYLKDETKPRCLEGARVKMVAAFIMDLRDQRLQALTELPDVGDPATVATLNVSSNLLATLPEMIISMLSGLTVLDASDNKLTALTDAIGECTELEELILYRNGIKALPAAVGKLKKLRVLNVFNNQLIKLPPELGSMSSLEEVNVAANKLLALTSVEGWTNVKVLNLYDNRLVRLASFGPLNSLVELRLYNNNLEVPPELPPNSALELLELHNNRIASLPDDYFVATPKLQRLLLMKNGLSTLPSSLTSCAALRFLQVGDNALTEVPSRPYVPSLAPQPLITTAHQVGLRLDSAVGSSSSRALASKASKVPMVSPLLCWPMLETLFLERNPIGALPAELCQSSVLLRCNLTGTAIDDFHEDVAQLRKQVLARTGSSFWSTDGRRWQADAASAAELAFVWAPKEEPVAAVAAVGEEEEGEEEKEEEEEEEEEEDAGPQVLCCDGINCGKVLTGEMRVWHTAAGRDYCEECKVKWANALDREEGSWMTAEWAVHFREEDEGKKKGRDIPKERAASLTQAKAQGQPSSQKPPVDTANDTANGGPSEALASQLAALQKEQATQAAQLKELAKAKETLEEQLEAARVAREAYAAQARAQAAAELRLRQSLSASGSPAYAADSPGYVAGSPALPGGSVMWRPELDEEVEGEEEGKAPNAGSPSKSSASSCQGLPPASPSKVWRPDLAEASVPVVADPKRMAKQPSSSGAWWGDARCCGLRGRDPAITDGERNPYDLTIVGNLLRHYRMMVDQAQSDHHRKATALD